MNDLQTTINNLERIYIELPILADKIPSIRGEFNMIKIGCYSSSTLANPFCQTYGCGLGNSARVFDLSKKEYYNDEGGFRYTRFSDSVLPSLRSEMSLWSYLFSSEWGYYNSKHKTFEDFISRVASVIKLLKEKGVCEVDYNPYISNRLICI